MQVNPSQKFVEGEFEMTCRVCGFKAKVPYPTGAGWHIGFVVPRDVSNSTVGRCSRCKRYKMEVTKAPEGPAPVVPVGFDKVPTE